ncbi:hypothetical protein CB0940_02069 [Cercospora beticola]|uniref:Uncharacterized protein n=1 Tax=Cercospora beticola TaxID=122368 RepID=A0A2G5I6H5_CERBT|nr:hypothetical protein CB0940_02069 [Cercospora beticola]PIB00428.1 hypothetical protein CB0940_02069 [Cercospora beticola]WPA97537.1 hypothetical protein RHO25_002147 [Cercospora beticola]
MNPSNFSPAALPWMPGKMKSCDLCSQWFRVGEDISQHECVPPKANEPDIKIKQEPVEAGSSESPPVSPVTSPTSAERPGRRGKARGFELLADSPATRSNGEEGTSEDSNPEGITDTEDWTTDYPSRLYGPDGSPLPSQRTGRRAPPASGPSPSQGKRPSPNSDRANNKRNRPSAEFTFSPPQRTGRRGPRGAARPSLDSNAAAASSPNPPAQRQAPEVEVAQAVSRMVQSRVDVVSHNERLYVERMIASKLDEYRQNEATRFHATLVAKWRANYQQTVTELTDERFNHRWEEMNDGFKMTGPILKIVREAVDQRFNDRVKQLGDKRGSEQGLGEVKDEVKDEMQRRLKMHERNPILEQLIGTQPVKKKSIEREATSVSKDEDDEPVERGRSEK